MAASAKLMMMDAERRFPVRIRIGVPLEGLGDRLDQMRTWLDGNCGADGWAIAHSGDYDRPFRPKVITGSGDHDHAVRPPRGPA